MPGTAANTGATGPAGTSNVINLLELTTYSESLKNGALNISLPNNSTNFLHNNIEVKHFSPLQYGLNGTVNTLTYYESPYFENILYIGGNFKGTNVTNQNLNNIAMWDGTHLIPLGSGLSGPCYTIASDSVGDIYAGGSFTSAGGVSMTGLAKWNGVNWRSLENALPIICYSISIDDNDNLYAFGNTLRNEILGVIGMYKWNGHTWSSIGKLINETESVYGIGYASYFNKGANTIIVGGKFNKVEGPNRIVVDANAIACLNLNTMTWSSFGNGLRNSKGETICTQIQVDNLGNIYASGDFDTIDGYSGPIPGFAKWNGSQWSPIFTTI
jgi:hypothetical protein